MRLKKFLLLWNLNNSTRKIHLHSIQPEVLLTVWFYKFFKLSFLKQLSWPKTMYAEHWRKLAWATFQGNFLIPLVQHFCGALMNSCLLEHAPVFPIKKKFSHITGYFDFLFWFRPGILLSKTKSFFLIIYSSPQWAPHYFNYYYRGKCVLIYKSKDFR